MVPWELFVYVYCCSSSATPTRCTWNTFRSSIDYSSSKSVPVDWCPVRNTMGNRPNRNYRLGSEFLQQEHCACCSLGTTYNNSMKINPIVPGLREVKKLLGERRWPCWNDQRTYGYRMKLDGHTPKHKLRKLRAALCKNYPHLKFHVDSHTVYSHGLYPYSATTIHVIV